MGERERGWEREGGRGYLYRTAMKLVGEIILGQILKKGEDDKIRIKENKCRFI